MEAELVDEEKNKMMIAVNEVIITGYRAV